MKKHLLLALAALPALALSGCAAGYGGGVYAGGPFAYDGYYDDAYGPIYDGYWGGDGFFYYRGGAHERGFHRGDAAHFRRDAGGNGHFHPMQGTMTPGRGMHMPHFPGGRSPARGGHH
jgi:hypothetical protein